MCHHRECPSRRPGRKRIPAALLLRSERAIEELEERSRRCAPTPSRDAQTRRRGGVSGALEQGGGVAFRVGLPARMGHCWVQRQDGAGRDCNRMGHCWVQRQGGAGRDCNREKMWKTFLFCAVVDISP